MPVKVMIPSPLRPYAGKRDSAEFSARTVGEALGHLTTEFGELRKHLFTEDGKLRSFVNVYVNDEDIRYLLYNRRPARNRQRVYRTKKFCATAAISSCRKSAWRGSSS